jgi:hypothetical protein
VFIDFGDNLGEKNRCNSHKGGHKPEASMEVIPKIQDFYSHKCPF